VVLLRTLVPIVAHSGVGVVFAPLRVDAHVIGAGQAVVAVYERGPGHTHSAGAGIPHAADVVVAAFPGHGVVHTPEQGVAHVARTRIPVVAGVGVWARHARTVHALVALGALVAVIAHARVVVVQAAVGVRAGVVRAFVGVITVERCRALYAFALRTVVANAACVLVIAAPYYVGVAAPTVQVARVFGAGVRIIAIQWRTDAEAVLARVALGARVAVIARSGDLDV